IMSKSRIVSTGCCKVYQATNLHSLLRQIIPDIAQNILYLSRTIEESVSNMVGKRDVRLTVVGITGHLTFVQRALQEKGIRYDINEHHSAVNTERTRGGSDSIAIVAMAGRCPGAER